MNGSLINHPKSLIPKRHVFLSLFEFLFLSGGVSLCVCVCACACVCVCVCVCWVVEGGAVIVSPFIWAYCSLALLVFIAVSVSPSLSVLHNLVFHCNYNYLFMFPSIFLPQSLPSSINSYNVMSPCSCFSNSRDFLIRKLLAEIIFFNLSILRHSSALLSPDYPSSLEAPQGWVENSHAGHPHDCSWVMEAPA